MPSRISFQPTRVETNASTGSSSFRIPANVVWIALGLAGLTCAVYARTLHNGFINYDDDVYIYANPIVQRGLTWHGIVWAFQSTYEGNWVPLSWISFMSTAQAWGANPFGYHLTNLLLHIANVILVFLLLWKGTDYLGRSTLVAGLFAVFPMNVEAVAWAAERKGVLSTFFLLLALFAYGGYAIRPSRGRYLAVAVFFALGLMAKAILVPFPFALLLLDVWPLRRFNAETMQSSLPLNAQGGTWLRLVLEKIPLLALSLLATGVGLYAARRGGAFSISAAHVPITLRVENAIWSYFMYVLKGLWPAHLAIIYPYPQYFLPIWKIAVAGTFLVGMTVFAWTLRAKPYLLVGWLWFLGMLLPVIGLIQTGTQSMADRWAYVPFLGLFVAVVWSIAEAIPDSSSRKTLGLAGTAVLIAYGCITFVETSYWRNGFTVFSHAVNVTTANGTARVNLGSELERMGRPDLALEQYQQAVKDTPALGTAHYNLARLLAEEDREDEAITEYRLAVANTENGPELGRAHTGLGAALLAKRDRAAAMNEFNAALGSDPRNVYALLDRGMTEYREDSLETASADFERAAQLAPTPMTWYTLGVILEKKGNLAGAAQAYQTALQMKPDLSDAQNHLRGLRERTPR